MNEQQLSLDQAFDLGGKLLQEGDPKQAADIFSRIVAAFPAFVPARIQLAYIANSYGDPGTAERVLRPLMHGTEQNSNVLYTYCKSLLLQGKFDEALTLIREGIATAPDLWRYHQMLGEILEKKGDTQNAEPAFWRCLELNPDNTGTAILLTLSLTRQLHLDQAIDKLEALIRIRPESIIYRYMHCSSIVQRAKIQGFDVVESLSSAITTAISPEMKALYVLFSSAAYFRLGDIPKANRMVKQAHDILRKNNFDFAKLLSSPSPDQTTKLGRYLGEQAINRNNEDDFYLSDDYLTKVYWEYFQVSKQEGSINNDSSITQYNYGSLAREIIASQAIDTVANFGCFCASNEQILSSEFPGVQFHGIDRAPLIKSLNDEHFKTSNTTYYVDDMLHWLEHTSPVKNGMLVHMRTAVYALPAFLEKLYRLARSKGYRHVLLLENVGFDRNTLTYPVFDTGFQSFMLRNWILVHDYPAILKRCGYYVGEQSLVPLVNVNINLFGAPKPDGSESLGSGCWVLPDMHLLCLHATAN